MAKARPKTEKQLKDAREKLLARRQELEEQKAELERTSLGVSQTELTGEGAFDDEYADSGTATFERERDLSLAENLRDLLEKVDRALERVDEGTYGMCESCGKPIEAARLRALPYANLCISCARREVAPR